MDSETGQIKVVPHGRVIITHVPAGSGHEKAAEALTAAFRQLRYPVEMVLLNALDPVNGSYRWCFTQGYLRLIRQAPLLWGCLYYLTDLRFLARPVQALHRVSNSRNGRGLESLLLRLKPDVVIGTHFFPMEVAAYLKRRGRISARLITVITDYLPHALWVVPGIDGYAVGSFQAREDLIARGVPPDRIRILGIPIDPKFGRSNDRKELKERLGLDPHRFVVLIGSGGEGVGPVVSLTMALAKIPKPIQILVIAGKNGSLVKTLESLKSRIPHPMKIYGFVDNVDELMEVSDLMISKPGGLTCAEAMSKGLPLIGIPAIPGQETRNLRVLAARGAVREGRRVEEISRMVEDLYTNAQRLKEMRRRAFETGCPDAAFKIARWAMDSDFQ